VPFKPDTASCPPAPLLLSPILKLLQARAIAASFQVGLRDSTRKKPCFCCALAVLDTTPLGGTSPENVKFEYGDLGRRDYPEQDVSAIAYP